MMSKKKKNGNTGLKSNGRIVEARGVPWVII